MWTSEWDALSARVLALLEVGKFYVDAGPNRGRTGLPGHLFKEAREIVVKLREFRDNHAPVLPKAASTVLDDFIQEFEEQTSDKRFPNDSGGVERVEGAVGLLASLRAQLEYLLTDFDTFAESRVARAFEHLQRSIVVDAAVRLKWSNAWQKYETRCEKLGGVHFLLHGIWAFKADANGGKTDLVLREPLKVDEGVRRAADALVLTEWKRVPEGATPGQIKRLAKVAYKQAKDYSGGILAGFELASRRYIVLVSRNALPGFPREEQEDGSDVVYEYRNVVVDPIAPSKQARKSAGQG